MSWLSECAIEHGYLHGEPHEGAVDFGQSVLFKVCQVLDSEMANEDVDGTTARYILATIRALGEP